jgi:hypothetical protein
MTVASGATSDLTNYCAIDLPWLRLIGPSPAGNTKSKISTAIDAEAAPLRKKKVGVGHICLQKENI